MLEEMMERYPELESCREDIVKAKETLIACFQRGGKLLLCGNGGSCADCDHIVGELMKGFRSQRPLSCEKKAQMRSQYGDMEDDILEKLQNALPAISLPSFTALNTAYANDVAPELMYAQGVLGLAAKNDILLAISTSGNSKNVVAAAKVAKALGLQVIALTGAAGGMLRTIADICICVPQKETYKVQELHLPVYHCLCEEIEMYFFGEDSV